MPRAKTKAQTKKVSFPIKGTQAGAQLQADLMFLTDIAKMRDLRSTTDKTPLLVVIDVFSRYLFIKKLSSKNSRVIATALESIIEKIKTKFKRNTKRLTADNEFRSNDIVAVCRKHGIEQDFSVANIGAKTKTSVIERVIGTIRTKLRKKRADKKTGDFDVNMEVLQSIVDEYNTKTIHSTIKTEPAFAMNTNLNFDYRRPPPVSSYDIKPGTKVKLAIALSKSEETYGRKGDIRNWSKEVYTIEKRIKGTKKFKIREIAGKLFNWKDIKVLKNQRQKRKPVSEDEEDDMIATTDEDEEETPAEKKARERRERLRGKREADASDDDDVAPPARPRRARPSTPPPEARPDYEEPPPQQPPSPPAKKKRRAPRRRPKKKVTFAPGVSVALPSERDTAEEAKKKAKKIRRLKKVRRQLGAVDQSGSRIVEEGGRVVRRSKRTQAPAQYGPYGRLGLQGKRVQAYVEEKKKEKRKAPQRRNRQRAIDSLRALIESSNDQSINNISNKVRFRRRRR